MKPHPHAEYIKAWADGQKIEYRSYETIEWKPIFKGWSWDNTLVAEYRIKPQPKPDFVEKFCLRYNAGIEVVNFADPNIKFTFDGETGKLKSAEVL